MSLTGGLGVICVLEALSSYCPSTASPMRLELLAAFTNLEVLFQLSWLGSVENVWLGGLYFKAFTEF